MADNANVTASQDDLRHSEIEVPLGYRAGPSGDAMPQ
jgi:hypothetical protein